MFPLPSGSTSSQATTVVTDQGQLNQKSTVFQGNAKGASGKGAQYAETGSLLLGDKAQLNSGLLSGTSLKGYTGNISISNSDPDVLKEALGQVSKISESNKDFLGNLVSKVTETSAAAAGANSANLDKVLEQISTLAESKQTDGQSGQNKTVLYIVVAIAVAVVAVFIFRRKG